MFKKMTITGEKRKEKILILGENVYWWFRTVG